MYSVYILQSKKTGEYYVGFSSDLKDRLRRHNQGQNPSTKAGRPWEVVYSETFPTKQSAWMRERQIKKYKGGEAFKKLVTE